jgi:hypothetical protein
MTGVELDVDPDDLGAAAGALQRLSADLRAALDAFACAHRAAPLGGRAGAAVSAAARDALHGGSLTAANIETAARGLRRVAASYAEVDARAMGASGG